MAKKALILEPIPTSLNRAKSDKVTVRTNVFAKMLYEARQLSEEGLEGVLDISSK